MVVHNLPANTEIRNYEITDLRIDKIENLWYSIATIYRGSVTTGHFFERGNYYGQGLRDGD